MFWMRPVTVLSVTRLMANVGSDEHGLRSVFIRVTSYDDSDSWDTLG